jgi:hypothetical protein
MSISQLLNRATSCETVCFWKEILPPTKTQQMLSPKKETQQQQEKKKTEREKQKTEKQKKKQKNGAVVHCRAQASTTPPQKQHDSPWSPA